MSYQFQSLIFCAAKRLSEDYVRKLRLYEKMFRSHKKINLRGDLQKELNTFLSHDFQTFSRQTRGACAAKSKFTSMKVIMNSTYELLKEECTEAVNDPHFILHPNKISEVNSIRHSQQSTSRYSSSAVPVMALTKASDKDINKLLSLFSDIDIDEKSRTTKLEILTSFFPIVSTETPHGVSMQQTKNCSKCEKKFSVFSKPNECYWCGGKFCKSCPVRIQAFSRLGPKPQSLCTKCTDHFQTLDLECWTEASINYVSKNDLKASLGCLAMAVSVGLEIGNVIEPVKKAIHSLLSGHPQVALILIMHLMNQTSKNSVEMLKVTILATMAVKKMAEDPSLSSEEKWNLMLASNEVSCYAMELESSIEHSIEIPSFRSTHEDIKSSLCALSEIKIHEDEMKLFSCTTKLESLWHSRDLKGIVTALTSGDSIYIDALEAFIKNKDGYINRMLPSDRYPIIFLRGVLKLVQGQVRPGLDDIESAAWYSLQDDFLSEEIIHVFLVLLNDPANNLFLLSGIREACTAPKSVIDSSEPIYGGDKNNLLLLPPPSDIKPPFSQMWPEFSIQGHNVKCFRKYEMAVFKQVTEKMWTSWEAGLAYIDLISSCSHPSEFVLCFLHASFWLLDDLEKKPKLALNKVFAHKELIINILQQVHGITSLALHPGMQLYVSRLALRILTSIFQLKDAKQIISEEDCKLYKQLLQVIVKTGRMNPFWQAHAVPVSEALILNITSGRLHSDFLLGLQDVDPLHRPISETELKYQLYENDLRCITPLPDSACARERAMESLLHEKGYSWEDVVRNLTSHLSPRDSEGWLQSQNSRMGTRNLEYAELKGFVIDLDNNSIEIIVTPANPREGKVGLFSQEDIAAVLQLESSEVLPIYFSLDPPSKHERFHPFQLMTTSSDRLYNTDLLHTLFQTDYLLKSFSVGAEVSSNPPFNQRPCSDGLTKNLPSRLKRAIRPVAERGPSLSNIHRFWIQADELPCDQHHSGSKIEFRFGEMKMCIRSHPLLYDSNGKLIDTLHEDDPESPEATFASDLTKHYDELGLHFPIFLRLRELCKLQVYGALVHSMLKDLESKADGVGVTVSRELLTEIQTDARQQYQANIDEALSNLSREVGVWPAADDHCTVSAEIDRVMRDLPYNVVAYRSDVQPLVEDALHKKDQSTLSQIVDAFVESSSNQLSRYSLESHVRAWLSSRNSNSTRELRDFICSSMPLPTSSEIRQSLIQSCVSQYNSFNRLVKSLKKPSSPTNCGKSCHWVPAAVLIKEDLNSRAICYGGVLVAPKIIPARIGTFRGSTRYISVQNCTVSYRSNGKPVGIGGYKARVVGGSKASGLSHPWDNLVNKKGRVNRPKMEQGKKRSINNNARAAVLSEGSGNGNGSDGSGSDDDWDKIKKEATCKAEHRGTTYYKRKGTDEWISRDTAGHGGAAFKVWKDKRSKLVFHSSYDENFKKMEGKHESNQRREIMKSHLIVKRGCRN